MSSENAQYLEIKRFNSVQFKNNCHTDTLVVSFMNLFTAIFCGFAVFGMLGFMAANLNVDVSEVVRTGPGLAFIGK